MMSQTRNAFLGLAACAILGPWACCAEKDSWASVMALHTGDRISVLESGSKNHSGVLSKVTEESVTLQEHGAAEVSIPRPNVLRISRPAPSKRLRNTLIGLAAGVGIGLAIDQSIGHFKRNETGGDGGRALSYTLPLAGGALIGAFASNSETIYRPKGKP